MNEATADIARFIGHFHPVLVHLPIGALLLLGALEAVSLRPAWRTLAAGNRAILWITAPAGVFAAVCGWLLAEGGGYDAELLDWHRWSGVSVAALVPVLLMLHHLGRVALYRAGLGLALVLVSVAGHFGGSLTHGRDFLTRHAPEPLRSLLGGAAGAARTAPGGGGAAGASFAAEGVLPVLERHCVSCHGPDKQKGGLRLDTVDAVMAGGDSGPVLVPGRPGESPLVTRIRLPLEHDDHMPPSGKSQPEEGEVRLLEWWIGNGASVTGTARDLNVPAELERMPAARQPGA